MFSLRRDLIYFTYNLDELLLQRIKSCLSIVELRDWNMQTTRAVVFAQLTFLGKQLLVTEYSLVTENAVMAR